jgi:hypothetical protein
MAFTGLAAGKVQPDEALTQLCCSPKIFGTKVYPHVSFSKNPNFPMMKTSELAMFVGTLHTHQVGKPW